MTNNHETTVAAMIETGISEQLLDRLMEMISKDERAKPFEVDLLLTDIAGGLMVQVLASEPCPGCRKIKRDRLQALLDAAMGFADGEHIGRSADCGTKH